MKDFIKGIKKVFTSALFMAVVLGCYGGCTLEDSLSEEEKVEFRLPYKGSWYVTYVQDRLFKSVTVEGDSFSIWGQKNKVLGLTAYSHGEYYGGIYPYNCMVNKDTAFASQILLLAQHYADTNHEEKNQFLSRFNWEKFIEETRALGKKEQFLDKEKIAESICHGEFNKKLL